MPLSLYAHPFSSYCQKVLIALYENETPFEYRTLEDPQAMAELVCLWPHRKFPVLLDEGKLVIESSVIIEYLVLNHPGASKLIPGNAADALQARWLDRIFDNYVMTPMMKLVSDTIRAQGTRDVTGVAEARACLDTSYKWLDGWMKDREWATGSTFSLADCAAAPSLFYADWAHEIPDNHRYLRAYRKRLLERPSFARAVNEARPHRPFFPLGAPDRD
jgi:glutathione S-transferase